VHEDVEGVEGRGTLAPSRRDAHRSAHTGASANSLPPRMTPLVADDQLAVQARTVPAGSASSASTASGN
jgi:hypothetical protein